MQNILCKMRSYAALTLLIATVMGAMVYSNQVMAHDLPVATDSRIKTFVYNQNEVFRIIIHYGYQTSIEFAEGEEIETISIGNNYAWQLTPLGRRLFIKPLEENIITNMTVLTNLRAYHFEVQSKLITYTIDEELAYVVRFYYPEDNIDAFIKNHGEYVADADKMKDLIYDDKYPYNFNYTLSGNRAIAPLQVFDDGRNTYFKFDNPRGQIPMICAIKGGKTVKTLPKQRGDYVVVDLVSKQFTLDMNGKKTKVYNEDMR